MASCKSRVKGGHKVVEVMNVCCKERGEIGLFIMSTNFAPAWTSERQEVTTCTKLAWGSCFSSRELKLTEEYYSGKLMNHRLPQPMLWPTSGFVGLKQG